MRLFAAVIATICIIILPFFASSLYENERVEEYHKRKYRWPPAPSDYVPNTPGWQSICQRRLNQTAYIKNSESKYNAYMSVVHSALISPNFTEFGWGLTKAPKSLVDALLENLMSGLAHADDLPVEDDSFDSSDDKNNYGVSDDGGDKGVDEFLQKRDDENPQHFPLMIPNFDLNRRALKELLPIHEAWSGVKLTGNNAYGLRVYRNHSNLQMHIDESTTHIISSILHVGHDPEGEPWVRTEL